MEILHGVVIFRPELSCKLEMVRVKIPIWRQALVIGRDLAELTGIALLFATSITLWFTAMISLAGLR